MIMANNIMENFSDSSQFLPPIQNKLIKLLEENGPMTRKDLVNKSNSARTTIYDNLVKLQKLKQIEKFSRNNGERGRSLVFWKLTE